MKCPKKFQEQNFEPKKFKSKKKFGSGKKDFDPEKQKFCSKNFMSKKCWVPKLIKKNQCNIHFGPTVIMVKEKLSKKKP